MKRLIALLLLTSFMPSSSSGTIHSKAKGEYKTNSKAEGCLNPILLENLKEGTPDWQITNPATQREIEGYASLTSVARGKQIQFFVNTSDPTYKIDIFRLGWYDGKGGRRVKPPIHRPGVVQDLPSPDAQTGLIECNWKDPYTLEIPLANNEWISGAYVAKLTGDESKKESYILFFIRDDLRTSDFIFQSSVTTFQAYNNWGGKSLYNHNSTENSRAYEVSFNRPYGLGLNPESASGLGAGEFFTDLQPAEETSAAGWEYNMVRFLEREGYDVTYATDVDTHANPNLLLSHKGFLSVGHDEYWSKEMRDHVEAARDSGIHLGFFGANASYWQIRYAPSTLTQIADRTITCYKEADLDPIKDNRATIRWRSPLLNRPEAQMVGVMYKFDPVNTDLVIDDTSHWVFENTGLKDGDHFPGLLGYEVDQIFGSSPKEILRLAHSPYLINDKTYFSDMTIYTATSGAFVFATGSMQWNWGLDDYGAPQLRPPLLNYAAQQMTRNILDHMRNPTYLVKLNTY